MTNPVADWVRRFQADSPETAAELAGDPAELLEAAQNHWLALEHRRARGRLDGAYWNGDAAGLMAAWGIDLKLLGTAEWFEFCIECGRQPSRTWGMTLHQEWPDQPQVRVSRGQPHDELLLTLAHELSHCIWQSGLEVEALHEAYAEGFVSQRRQAAPTPATPTVYTPLPLTAIAARTRYTA